MKPRVIRLLGYALVLIGLVLLVLVNALNKQSLTELISNWSVMDKWSQDQLNDRITLNARLVMGLAFVLITILGGWITAYANSISGKMHAVREWLFQISRRLSQIPSTYKLVALGILIISFGFNLFNVITRPIFYDEAWTYLNFTSQGLATAISYYPLPNNHVLHTVLTVLSCNLPFGTTINLRLPSLFMASLTAVVFGYSTFRLFGKRIALLLLPVFSLLFPVAYYSYLSRGYMLVLLAFIICFYSSLRLVENECSFSAAAKYNRLLMIGGIIGLYTMPSFVYPLFCCVSFVMVYWLINGEKRLMWQLMKLNVISALVVFLLYSPIILRSGWSALTNNEMVRPLPRSQVWDGLWEHFSKTTEFLFDLPLFLFLSLLLLVLILLLSRGIKTYLSLYLLVMPPVLLMVHGVIPFPRTWIYLLVVILFLLGRVLRTLQAERKLKLPAIAIAGSVVITLFVLRFQYRIQSQEYFSYRAVEVSEKLIDEGANRVYVNHALMEINLRYIVQEENADMGIHFSREALTPSVINRVGQSCDWLILDQPYEGSIQWEFTSSGDYPMYLGRFE